LLLETRLKGIGAGSSGDRDSGIPDNLNASQFLFSYDDVYPKLFATMARGKETPLRSVRHKRDTPRVVAPPDDLHEETHDSESSDDSEEYSDEDSDYGNCE